MTAQRDLQFYNDARQFATQMNDALNGLLALQRQWNALNYGSTLGDGVQANQGITAAQIGAVVFDTANAIKAVMDAGSGTNIANIL